jgi:hypothetical protein
MDNNQSNHNVPAGSSSVLVEIEYKFPFRRHRLRPERLWISTPLRPDSVDASMSIDYRHGVHSNPLLLPDNSPKRGYMSPTTHRFFCSSAACSVHTTYYLFHKRRGIRQGTPVRSLGPERN